MDHCHVCKAKAVVNLLNFGDQALCNRFLKDARDKEELFPFALGQCGHCGLIQIPHPISPDDLRPRFDWITYNEQEGHLDHLVETVCKLPGVARGTRVGAISFKDDSTLARFEKLGFGPTWRLQPGADLGIENAMAGLETVQGRLTQKSAAAIGQKNGLLDILIVRHILEHAHVPHAFAGALHALVKPGGYFVFEVPDCTPALERGDYTMFWEEHISCFTQGTFLQSLAALGFEVVHSHCYTYTNENSLVAIARSGAKTASPSHAPAGELERGRNYARVFPDYRKRAAEALAEYRRGGAKVALFGAGHLTCAWINFLGVQDQIDFVADDHPKKKGMFMPGSGLPILGSAMLLERGVKLCLLGLSPESEARVVRNQEPYIKQGGAFACIFPGRSNSFPG